MTGSEVSILLVEDDDVDAEAIKRAFAKAKIVNPVVRARDGLEGLEMLRTRGAIAKPYIILLDLKMPRMNGLAFLEQIRIDDQLHDSVVFVLTTSRAETDVSAAYDKYVAGYIVKSQVGSSFSDLIGLLDHYWRLVELPRAAR